MGDTIFNLPIPEQPRIRNDSFPRRLIQITRNSETV